MSPYARTILDDAPLAYWRLGELSGTSAADTSGNAHAGTYTGTFGLGQAGAVAPDNDASAKFDGSTSYVALPVFASLTTWTVEGWVKPNGNQITDATILTAGFLGGTNNVNYVICFNHDAAGGGNPLSLYAGYWNGSWHITSGFAVASLAWAHVVGTYDGANIQLYVNGQLRSTVASASMPASSGIRSKIGSWWGSDVAGFLTGWIDEVALYTGALSAGRILSHYNAGITPGMFASPLRRAS